MDVRSVAVAGDVETYLSFNMRQGDVDGTTGPPTKRDKVAQAEGELQKFGSVSASR